MNTYFVKNDFGLRPKQEVNIERPKDNSEVITKSISEKNLIKLASDQIILEDENKRKALKSSFSYVEDDKINKNEIEEKEKEKEIIKTPTKSPKHQSKDIYRLKVILLGNVAVGKTSLLNQYIVNKFSNEYTSSIGVEFKVKSLAIDDKTTVDLQIWDTCGQEKFRTLTRQYYREANAVMLIFDLTNKNSFNDVKSWITDVKDHGPKNCLSVLVGNKSDLKSQRVISFNDAVEFAKTYDMDYFEVSAKSGEGIQFIFDIMSRTLVKSIIDGTIFGNFDYLRRKSSCSSMIVVQGKERSKGCC